MRWPAFLLAFVLALSFVVPPVAADDAPSLGDAPIQHHGRIKPLDTFARVNLLATYGKRSADDLTAMDWMLDLTTAPQLEELRCSGNDLMVPMVLDTPAGELRFISMIATIGAPFDVTLEELRLETLLPADRHTESVLRGEIP